jgi:hypothetical protein
MQITIQPFKTKKRKSPKISLPEPQNARGYKQNEIRKEAFDKKYSLEILPKSAEHVEVSVIDGKKKKYLVQYFKHDRTIACCSCQNYCIDEARYCLHLAAIDNLLEYRQVYMHVIESSKWANTLRIRLARIGPKLIQRYAFWDPYKAQMFYFGSRLPEIETVSTQTYNKLLKLKTQSKVGYLPTTLTDENLLCGVSLYEYQKDILALLLLYPQYF